METLKDIWVKAMISAGIPLEDLDTEGFDEKISGYVITPIYTQEMAIEDVRKIMKTYHFEEEK